MAEVSQIERVGIDKLIPYINNAKIHSDSQVTKIASSIREFGFVNPVLIDKNFNVIAGHGRIKAAEKLGLDEVPCVYVEGLTEAQRKAYILADNKLGEFASWDLDMITNELEGLQSLDFDVELTGFELERLADDWFETRTRNDTSRQEGNEEYNEFLDKFETKKNNGRLLHARQCVRNRGGLGGEGVQAGQGGIHSTVQAGWRLSEGRLHRQGRGG